MDEKINCEGRSSRVEILDADAGKAHLEEPRQGQVGPALGEPYNNAVRTEPLGYFAKVGERAQPLPAGGIGIVHESERSEPFLRMRFELGNDLLHDR